MTNSLISYILESSICLLLFLTVYRLLIANLTHFSWMRIYLLSSVILSMILPLLVLPIHWSSTIHPLNFNFLTGTQPGGNSDGQPITAQIKNNWGSNLLPGMITLILVVYLVGFIYRACNFVLNLRSIQKCIKQNPKVRDDRFWLVELIDKVPPFSFFNYIFINDSCQKLPEDELRRIKEHEKIHSRQYHSLDVLFIEFVSVIFWFNPLLIYLKKSIQEIHEFIVDEKIAAIGSGKKGYAELLLKLTSDVKVFNLSAGFSGSQIKRRIAMITRPRSLPVYKLLFLILIPVTLLIMLSFSYIKNPDPLASQTVQNGDITQSRLKIGKIIWKGNTIYDEKTLNQALCLKTGSVYDKSVIEDRLNGSLGAKDAVSNLYLDNGYLYSRITFSKEQNKGNTDLTITIYEGKQAKINDVIVKINGVVTKDPVNEIVIRKGELFSKAKIIRSIIALAVSGKYDPDKINPSPNPHQTDGEFDSVDLIFDLTEISNKK